MADNKQEEKALEPRAVTYKEVEKAANAKGVNAQDLWKQIGVATGAGVLGLDPDGNRSIDISGMTAAERAKIDNLLKEK